ncbi:MAG: pilus assembly protein [Gemmataceae bacterium]|nr:pilus assembly protein [Gemmataceae bacterium]
MMLRRPAAARRGVAAVEVALVTALFIAPTLIGVWELGRIIQVKQIVSNSAREGARLAAQGYAADSTGAIAPVTAASGTRCVRDQVYQYLLAAGFADLTPADVQVDFAFTAPRGDGQPATEPYQGEKMQPFTVTVTIPWAKVRWVNLGMIQPTDIRFTVAWRMLTNDRFTVTETMPAW